MECDSMSLPSSSCSRSRRAWKAPGEPPVKVAAVRAGFDAVAGRLIADQPNAGSSMNAWKMPIASTRPPTHAGDRVGSRPAWSTICASSPVQ